ncbi:tRNA (N(6)-L-threonylcarbamoyladenosine(37)-C(2))-methylthiotransferase [Candidatus Woesearchaeota archaeon]|nr:tRNA (N(6)-L-threonylcarbamoyladenosine(37)-C(2))-methylthiotransferase [Candidatus Woesearchaeota archaeon]
MANVHVRTYGCTLNRSDSEAIAGVLTKSGHHLVAEEEADIIVINSCTVKSGPEQRLFHQIRNAKKPIVVAGCVPQADPHNPHLKDVSVIGPKALSRAAYAVEQTLLGVKVTILDEEDEDRNALPVIRQAAHVGIVPLSAGCLGNCTYCKTKHARGRLQSYPQERIEQQCRRLINDGAQELWLTSQDAAAYGLDIGTDITSLLERLLRLPGDHRVRLGMANPRFLLPQLERFARLFRDERLFRFVHLPVQSGSDKVLEDMRRGYTAEQFARIAITLKRAVPDITIATDIIVGYPTETEEDFQSTARLIEELELPVVNVSKFYPRPGTLAAALPLLPTRKVKERSTRLKRVCEAVARRRNESFIGKELSVLIDEQGKQGTLIGRADNYLQVILPRGAGKPGERVTVTPSAAGTFDVRAF